MVLSSSSSLLIFFSVETCGYICTRNLFDITSSTHMSKCSVPLYFVTPPPLKFFHTTRADTCLLLGHSTTSYLSKHKYRKELNSLVFV